MWPMYIQYYWNNLFYNYVKYFTLTIQHTIILSYHKQVTLRFDMISTYMSFCVCVYMLVCDKQTI